MVGEVIANGTLTLPLPEIFSFRECLRFLGRNKDECLHQVQNNLWYHAAKIGGKTVLMEVGCHGDELRVKPLNTSLNHMQQGELVSYIEEIFDLKRDLEPFYGCAKRDPMLATLCQRYFGLRLLGIPDLFESLCWCIIGQQINLAFAYRLKKRLVSAAGEAVSYQGRDYYVFPTPGEVAQLPLEAFGSWQFSRSKATYLVGIAREMLSGNLNKALLLDQSPEEVEQELLKLKGIGPWSAHYVMMKCLRITSAFPVGDVGLQNAVKIQQGWSQKPSIRELHSLARGWHPWESYATFYLWHSLIS